MLIGTESERNMHSSGIIIESSRQQIQGALLSLGKTNIIMILIQSFGQ